MLIDRQQNVESYSMLLPESKTVQIVWNRQGVVWRRFRYYVAEKKE